MSSQAVDAANDTFLPTSRPVLILTIAEACAMSRVGRTAIYAAIREGDLIARKCGRRTLIHINDLTRWIDGFPVAKSKRR